MNQTHQIDEKYSHVSLSDCLQSLAELGQERGVSVGEIFKAFEAKGFGLLLVILSMPSALPIPAPGYSTPFGLVLALLGLQMLCGRTRPWLPDWAKNLRLSPKITVRMVQAGTAFFGYFEKWIRPRMHWIHQRGGRIFLAVLIIFMSCLMILPIPLTNTAPAMVIFLIGVALCEEDGLFGLLAALAGLAAVALYSFVIYLAIHLFREYGWEGVQNIKEVIKDKLGLTQ